MTELDKKLDDFIAHTGASKVAVIVPLYGYWKDIEENPLNLQTLQLSMDRITSSIHNVYIFFVAESERMPTDIQNYIVVQSKAGGNCKGVQMKKGSSYTDYIRSGMDAAQNNTGSAYFLVLNPWNLIQRVGIDMMVDRLNYGDEAKIVSGFNLRPEITADSFDPKEFENMRFNIPVEKYKVDLNFMGITRQFLEITPLDQNIKTAYYLEADIFQSMRAKGFAAVASQRIPMFVFEVNIESLENPEDLESDKRYFISKWGFIPEI
jgi:hypothetical protein